jgi:hypothetical protein
MRPVIFGAVIGGLLSAFFTYFNPAKGDPVTVIGLGVVLGALFAFVMVNLLLPYIEASTLPVAVTIIVTIAVGAYVVFVNTDWFGVDTHFPLGAALITGGVSTLLYHTGILKESE